MSEEKLKYQKFINYLEERKIDRGMMASLKKGYGKKPGTEPTMYPYIESWAKGYDGDIYYLIASLFAYYKINDSKSAQSGNMGDHFYLVINRKDDPAEKRFSALLSANYNDLINYQLRQAISFLKSKDIAINWVQLMKDLRSWNNPEKFIQKKWASHFWK